MIVVCGEALIDFTPARFGDTQAYLPRPGGSPYNVAIGLGRLDTPTAFLGKISQDAFGRVLHDNLVSNSVDTRYLQRSDQLSTLAFVHLQEGREPEYSFYGEGTADRNLLHEDLPDSFSDDVNAIHFGSFSLAVEPTASTLASLMWREHGRRVLTLDPNVRPSLIPDRESYIARLEELVSLATLVKVSRADLEWLFPNEPTEAAANRWLESGPALVIVTSGSQGAIAYSRQHTISAKATLVEKIVDTVGAGDAFTSGLLAYLHHNGLLDNRKLANLDETNIRQALEFANKAAALTCARAGADPPIRQEIERLRPL